MLSYVHQLFHKFFNVRQNRKEKMGFMGFNEGLKREERTVTRSHTVNKGLNHVENVIFHRKNSEFDEKVISITYNNCFISRVVE